MDINDFVKTNQIKFRKDDM